MVGIIDSWAWSLITQETMYVEATSSSHGLRTWYKLAECLKTTIAKVTSECIKEMDSWAQAHQLSQQQGDDSELARSSTSSSWFIFDLPLRVWLTGAKFYLSSQAVYWLARLPRRRGTMKGFVFLLCKKWSFSRSCCDWFTGDYPEVDWLIALCLLTLEGWSVLERYGSKVQLAMVARSLWSFLCCFWNLFMERSSPAFIVLVAKSRSHPLLEASGAMIPGVSGQFTGSAKASAVRWAKQNLRWACALSSMSSRITFRMNRRAAVCRFGAISYHWGFSSSSSTLEAGIVDHNTMTVSPACQHRAGVIRLSYSKKMVQLVYHVYSSRMISQRRLTGGFRLCSNSDGTIIRLICGTCVSISLALYG